MLVAGVVVESRGATRDQPVGDVDGPRDADLAFVPVRLARSRAGWQVRMAGLRRSARAYGVGAQGLCPAHAGQNRELDADDLRALSKAQVILCVVSCRPPDGRSVRALRISRWTTYEVSPTVSPSRVPKLFVIWPVQVLLRPWRAGPTWNAPPARIMEATQIASMISSGLAPLRRASLVCPASHRRTWRRSLLRLWRSTAGTASPSDWVQTSAWTASRHP